MSYCVSSLMRCVGELGCGTCTMYQNVSQIMVRVYDHISVVTHSRMSQSGPSLSRHWKSRAS